MSREVQRRAGTTAEHSSFTGAAAELTIDETKNTVVVHNGSTVGGFPLALENNVLAKSGGEMSGNITNFESTGIDDNASANVITIDAGLQIGSPTGGDKGAGTLNLATDGLYFNGTQFGTGISNTFTAAQTISLTTAGTNLSLISTDSDGTNGPVLVLDRQSSTPVNGDQVGGIIFRGNDDAGSEDVVQILSRWSSVASGNSLGELSINTDEAGSPAVRVFIRRGMAIGSPTGGDMGAGTLNLGAGLYFNSTQFGLDIANAWTAPQINTAQPCVFAYNSVADTNVTGGGTTYQVEYNLERFDQGNNFNNTTSTFTAPVTGKYAVFVNMGLSGVTAAMTAVTINIVTSNFPYVAYQGDLSNVESQVMFTTNVIADMDEADTLTVNLTMSGDTDVVDTQATSTSISICLLA